MRKAAGYARPSESDRRGVGNSRLQGGKCGSGLALCAPRGARLIAARGYRVGHGLCRSSRLLVSANRKSIARRGAIWLLCLGICAVLSSCVSAPVVYAPSDMTNNKPSGSVTKLSQLLGNSAAPLRIVFLHGVGDHCPGYALDRVKGWLKDSTAKELGLVRQDKGAVTQHKINLSVFMGGAPDPNSNVQFEVHTYRWKLPEIAEEIPVQAMEITWSNLTQWLKTDQLSYDDPTVFTDQHEVVADCVLAPDPKVVPPIKTPPSRLWLDRVVKESVLDRDLADAVVYAGTYGSVIERGVAEALCHALTAQMEDDKRCIWPTGSAAGADKNRYLFVTHSLGGRILYDLLINLTGHDTEAKLNPFSADELRVATPFVSQMLAQTPAVYLMANQLSLIGLANVDTDARSANGPIPYLEFNAQNAPIDKYPLSGIDILHGRHRDVLSSLAAARTEAIGKFRPNEGRLTPVPNLNIIAFNDTNDLLTWHIPSWYGNANAIVSDANPGVRVVNVFVRNSFPLLIIESPAAAHDNYFVNKSVRAIIVCGAVNGLLSECR
jgi:hypothetical protein